MTSQPTTLRLRGLAKADALELRDGVGADIATLEEQSVPGGSYGEPATIIVAIIVAAKAISAVAKYLAERQQSHDQTVTQAIEITYPDGTSRSETLTYKAAADESPREAASAALRALPGLAEEFGATQ